MFPASMNVTLDEVKGMLPIRVVTELLDKIDDGEIPLGENSQMDESGDPVMTIWKEWAETQPLSEESTGSSSTPSLEPETPTNDSSDS